MEGQEQRNLNIHLDPCQYQIGYDRQNDYQSNSVKCKFNNMPNSIKASKFIARTQPIWSL